MTDRPSFAGRAAALLIGVLLFVAIAEVALRFAMPQWSDFYSARFMQIARDDEVGAFAIGTPGFDGWFAQNNGDFRTHIHVNDFGLRNDEPVSAANGAVWFVGDSMTFGWGVDADKRYSAVAGELADRPTYNVASPGADACGYRALVRRMPEGIVPSAAVIGLVLENDLAEYDCEARADEFAEGSAPPLIALKGWLTGHSALYNVLAVSLKRVDIVRRALIASGLVNQEQGYKRFFEPEQVGSVTASTADELAKVCRILPQGVPCAVLIVPARFELADGDQPYHAARLAMNEALAARDIDAIDPFNAFREAGFQPTHFLHDGHWSELGHRIAAEAVAEWLRAHPGS